MAILQPGSLRSISMSRQGVFVFRKGDKVLHPRHGAAVVEDLVELERFGEQRI